MVKYKRKKTVKRSRTVEIEGIHVELIRQFFYTHLGFETGSKISGSNLYVAFHNFCTNTGCSPCSRSIFDMIFTEMFRGKVAKSRERLVTGAHIEIIYTGITFKNFSIGGCIYGT